MDRIHFKAKKDFDLITEFSVSWFNKEYLVHFMIHGEGKLAKLQSSNPMFHQNSVRSITKQAKNTVTIHVDQCSVRYLNKVSLIIIQEEP